MAQQGEGPVLLSCYVVRPGKDAGSSGSSCCLCILCIVRRKVLTVVLPLHVETTIFILLTLIFIPSLCHHKIGFSCCYICLLLPMGYEHQSLKPWSNLNLSAPFNSSALHILFAHCLAWQLPYLQCSPILYLGIPVDARWISNS